MRLTFKPNKPETKVIQETAEESVKNMLAEWGKLYGDIMNRIITNKLCPQDKLIAKEVKELARQEDGMLTIFVSIATEIFLEQLLANGFSNLNLPLSKDELKNLTFAESYIKIRSK